VGADIYFRPFFQANQKTAFWAKMARIVGANSPHSPNGKYDYDQALVQFLYIDLKSIRVLIEILYFLLDSANLEVSVQFAI